MCDTCTTICPRCNLRFVAHYDHHKTCLVCWKEAKGYKLTLADHALRDLQFVLLEHEDYLAGRDTPAALTSDQIRDLIHLCHPDKHNGSERSTKLTKWLLDLRNSK